MSDIYPSIYSSIHVESLRRAQSLLQLTWIHLNELSLHCSWDCIILLKITEIIDSEIIYLFWTNYLKICTESNKGNRPNLSQCKRNKSDLSQKRSEGANNIPLFHWNDLQMMIMTIHFCLCNIITEINIYYTACSTEMFHFPRHHSISLLGKIPMTDWEWWSLTWVYQQQRWLYAPAAMRQRHVSPAVHWGNWTGCQSLHAPVWSRWAASARWPEQTRRTGI